MTTVRGRPPGNVSVKSRTVSDSGRQAEGSNLCFPTVTAQGSNSSATALTHTHTHVMGTLMARVRLRPPGNVAVKSSTVSDSGRSAECGDLCFPCDEPTVLSV